MSVWLHINNAHADALAEAGLTTFDAWMDVRGEREKSSGRSESLTVVQPAGASLFRVFLKRYRPAKPTMRFFLRSSRQRREAQNAMLLRAADIPAAEVVAAGESRRLGRVTGAFVATQGIENVRPLSDVMPELWGDPSPQARIRQLTLIDALARLVRRMHDLGYVDYDLHCRNVLVREHPVGEPELFVVDSPRGGRARLGRHSGQLRDLACLDVDARTHLSRTDRLRFYRTYSGRRSLGGDDRAAIREILHRFDRDTDGGRMEAAAAAEFDRVGGRGTVMLIREDCREMLRRNGFERFDDFLNGSRGRVINRHEIRDVAVMDLDDSSGPRTVFLKRFGPMLRKDTVMDLLLLRRVRTKARVEARMIDRFRRRGFTVPRVLAFGERHVMGRDRASFLMVEKLPEGRALDELLGELNDPERRLGVIRSVADFVRRMHESGLVHKDLYGKHVFVEERPDGSCTVATIDLQRASCRLHVTCRRRGRNLAALMVSIPPDTATWRERRAFLLRYLGVDRLDRDALRFVRECVIPRARKLSRRRVYQAWMPVLGVSL